MCKTMLNQHVVFILVSHTHIQSFSFITCPINQLCAKNMPIYMGCLSLFKQELQCLQHSQYDVARRVSKQHMSAKFQGLVLFSL